MAQVVILGAGLTGLSTAYHMEQEGFYDIEIFEKNDRPGGLLRSFQCDGFTFDFTGHLLHVSDAYFQSFLETLAPLHAFNQVERKSAIYCYDTLINYPFQMNLYGLPANVIYECIEGFIKRKSRIKQPKSFYDWALKYFGQGITNHFFDPYNSKLLACSIKKILPSWTGRFVPHTTLEHILKGALSNQEIKKVGYNSSFLYPKQEGIEFIIKKLLALVKTPVQCNQEVIEVDLRHKKIILENGKQIFFEHLVTTIPLRTLLSLIKNTSIHHFRDIAYKLKCNSVINFNLAFNKPTLGDKHWIYYPERQYPFYRLGFWHNVNRTSVKPDHTAIYGEVSYLPEKTTKKQISTLTEQAVKSALTLLNLTSSDIVLRKDLHLSHAYVLYDQWRDKNLATILSTLANDHAVHSTGRFGEWKYSSMQEAVLDGKRTASTILFQEKNKYNQLLTKHTIPISNTSTL